jgi:hypothetical protein
MAGQESTDLWMEQMELVAMMTSTKVMELVAIMTSTKDMEQSLPSRKPDRPVRTSDTTL